jgi:hypothetical protein
VTEKVMPLGSASHVAPPLAAIPEDEAVLWYTYGGPESEGDAVAPHYREIPAWVEKLTGAKRLATGIDPGVPQTGPGTIGRPRLAPAKGASPAPSGAGAAGRRADVDTAIQVAQLVLAILAVGTLCVAWHQWQEVKRRRRVDMYWKLFDVFSSPEIRDDASLAVEEIERTLDLVRQKSYTLGEQELDEARLETLAKRYWCEYYWARRDSHRKKQDRLARARIRFYAQTGVLTEAELVDRDLLFGLIGPSLDVDYPVLRVLLKANRQYHGSDRMYHEVDDVYKEYKKWKEQGTPMPTAEILSTDQHRD